MKILIAPDSYKESLSALETACAIEAGFKEVFPDAHYIKIPMADGGEGTVEALVAATSGHCVNVQVCNPLGQKINATYGLTSGAKPIAVIEMAAASGLSLIALKSRNPLLTSSFGTGELIRSALDAGARHIILGVGGSASNDGGVGMMQALGVQFLDEHNTTIDLGGGALARLARIDASQLDARIAECVFEVACDVDNPLIGPNGASAIFGPQKGASPEMVLQLDSNLAHLAQIIKQDCNIDVAHMKGTGAGGGLSAAAWVFLNGRLRSGVDIVADASGLADAMQDCDLVITGEGRTDSQTINGKTPIGVARIAKRLGKPVIALSGSLAQDHEIVHEHGIDAAFSAVSRVCTMPEAFGEAQENITLVAKNIAAVLAMGNKLKTG